MPSRPDLACLRSRGRFRAGWGLGLVMGGALLVGCVPDYLAPPPAPQETVTRTPAPTSLPPLAEARAENRSRHVAERFAPHPVVLSGNSGTESAALFFPASATAIVAAAEDSAQLRAASLAVFTHAPLLTYTGDNHAAVVNELTRLGATRVLTVGPVGLAEASGDITVISDPGTLAALGELTAHHFLEVIIEDPSDMVQAVANLDGVTPVVLNAAWAEQAAPEAGTPAQSLPAFPIGTRRDGQQGPLVVATPASSVAAVANARSFGTEVQVLAEADPRRSRRGLWALAGLADQPLVAVGEEFGSGAELSRAIREAEAAVGEATGAAAAPGGAES